MLRSLSTYVVIFGLGVGLVSLSRLARAESDPMVARGVEFLKKSPANQGSGECALVAIALLKADVLPSDPPLAARIAKFRARFSGSTYQPERTGGSETYEIACVAIALSTLPNEDHRSELQSLAQLLLGRQNPNGSWDYVGRAQGDTSISQYALLGLWEAENGGAQVPGSVWDRAASWFLSVQSAQGSWNYHRDEVGRPETISMTAAGVGSLLICQRQLARYRNRAVEVKNPLLQPLTEEVKLAPYQPTTSNATFDKAIQHGISWLGSNFLLSANDPKVGNSVFYGLYAIERMGSLADKELLGNVNWFEQGRQFLATNQKPSGAWNCGFANDELNTAWGILFLTRATAKTLRRIEIRKLGAGTLLGGRGLPKDLSSMTIAGGRVVSRPMNGAVEKMLAVLEDPRVVENADAALAGLIDRYQREGPQALKPFKDRFRKMLTDRDPGLRGVAAWSLARTGDLDVVPLLIDALTDGEENVVVTARQGLQLLSRKIDSFGPSPNASPAERLEAAQRWRQWYQTIRPLDLEGQDDDTPAVPARSPR